MKVNFSLEFFLPDRRPVGFIRAPNLVITEWLSAHSSSLEGFDSMLKETPAVEITASRGCVSGKSYVFKASFQTNALQEIDELLAQLAASVQKGLQLDKIPSCVITYE